MPSFVKISCQIKTFFIQEFDFDRSVCMIAIFYSGSVSAVATKEQLLGQKRTSAKFHINISKTECLVRVYSDRETDVCRADHLYIYIIGSPTFLCYKLREKLNTPQGITKNLLLTVDS